MAQILRVRLTDNPDDSAPLQELFDLIRLSSEGWTLSERKRRKQLTRGEKLSVYHPVRDSQVPS